MSNNDMADLVLIIDDDQELTELLGSFLKENGFKTATHHSGKGVTDLVKKLGPSAVILDVMLPEKNGLDVCRELREESGVPILMLTARGEVTDRVVGLELGADDYLPKPFEPRELLARVRSLLRRRATGEPGSIRTFQGIRIDMKARSVTVKDQEVELSSTEFEILALLSSEPGKAFDRDDILTHVRGLETENFSRSIDIVVSRLRAKLGDDAKHPAFIKTVWGAGYAFVGRKETKAA